jgi:uroporphyrinogen decarboxylase
VLAAPVRTRTDLAALRDPAEEEIAPEVIGALRLVRRELNGRGAALLGFAGAPWSLAAYLVQGRGQPGFPALRALAAADPALLDSLLERLTDLIARYLAAQVAAGADAVQLFDTWAGILSFADWSRLVRPHLVRLLQATRKLGVPRILFLQDASHLVAGYCALESEAVAVDWREDLAALRAVAGPDRALQGNLDPAVLLAGPAATRQAANALLDRMPARAHVVNLGHGITPDAPLESVEALIEVVHQEGERARG